MTSTETWIRPKDRDFMLERAMNETGQGLECCPSILEMVEPLGGMTQEGRYVELYRDYRTRQRYLYQGVNRYIEDIELAVQLNRKV